MTHSFTVSDIIPSTPGEIFDAWLDSEEHSKMTGGSAKCSGVINAKFTAWDGYIDGTNLEIAPCRRIVQSWRTAEFAGDDPSSTIELTLIPDPDGTRLTLRHTNIPDGQSDYEQ